MRIWTHALARARARTHTNRNQSQEDQQEGPSLDGKTMSGIIWKRWSLWSDLNKSKTVSDGRILLRRTRLYQSCSAIEEKYIYMYIPFREADARLVIQNLVRDCQIEFSSSRNNICFNNLFQLAVGSSKFSLTRKFSNGYFTIICKVTSHTWFVWDRLL